MEQIIECPCGTVLRDAELSGVVGQARAHAKTVHEMDLSEEQAASMAHPA